MKKYIHACQNCDSDEMEYLGKHPNWPNHFNWVCRKCGDEISSYFKPEEGKAV